MQEVWLRADQVSRLMGWKNGLHVGRVAKKQGWQMRVAEENGANGKHEREYLLDSLPVGAQLKYAANGVAGAPSASLSITRIETLPLFGTPAEPIPEAVRITVPEELRGQAEQRYAAIEPLLDFRKRTNGHRPNIRLANSRVVSTLNDLCEYIAAQQKPAVTPRTIFRWLDRFDTHGNSSLADRPRKDHGQSRIFEEHPAAAALLQEKFLHEGLSRQMSWEALVREWPKIGGKGEAPSYGTARNFLNALPEPLQVLAREGKEAHERKCSPFILRGKVPVMDWWISDHRVFDVLVRNSLFAELPQDKAFRLWFTALYDWGSRKIVGFCFAPTPSSRTISGGVH